MKMASFVIILMMGCASEEGVKIYNSNPEAMITSLAEGDSFLEGKEITLIGYVSDGNHNNQDLLVSWESGEQELCVQQMPDIDGSTSCFVSLGLNDTRIRLTVVDPEGAAGSHQVDINITENQPPTAAILSPVDNSQYYSDQFILLSAQLFDTEEGVESLSYSWTSSRDGLLPSTAQINSYGIVEQLFQLSEGQHALTLEVSDSGGKTTTETIAVFVGGVNHTPTCSISTPQSQTSFVAGQTITFSGLALDEDINNSLLSISWSSDQDGVFNTSIADSSGEMEFFYDGLSIGNHSILLRVEDEVGTFCTDSILVSIGSPPALNIASPLSGSVFSLQESIIFSGTVSDNEDIPSEIALSFSSDIDGVFSTQSPDSNGNIYFTTSTLQAGNHNIIIQATDTLGLYVTQSIQLRVNTPPPAPSVSLTPSNPTSIDALFAGVMEAPDADGDTVSFSYEWFQNGNSTLYTQSSIPATATSAGDVWRVRVTPNDGYIDGDFGEAEVLISSSSPEFTADATILPSSAVYTGTTLTCSAAAFDQEDGSMNPSYRWEIGGIIVGSGASHTVAAMQSNVGDSVYCIATVVDSDLETATSSSYVVIENTVPTAPSISISPSNPQANQDDLICTIDVASSDIDMQPISYIYSWQKNGVITNDSTSTILSSNVHDGDSWVCTVTPNDGIDNGISAQSASISISSDCPNSDAVFTTQSDVSAYELCTELNSITINSTSGINNVSLPHLVEVYDAIYVSNNSDLQQMSFPVLESIGGDIYFYHNYDMETLSLPLLEQVGGYFYLDTNISLFILEIDALVFVGSYSYFSNNTLLCLPELNWASISQAYHYDNGNRNCSTQSYVYTGSVQSFVVPNVTSIDVVLYGGSGGDGWNNDVSSNLGFGGEGAVVSASIPVTPGETLNIYVGGAGEDGTSSSWGTGGFNGGGDGSVRWNYYGGGGGGASDIRRGTSLGDRLVVAGGGGAGSGWCTAGTGNGGDAGGLQGQNGQMCAGIPVGIGGSQSAGGNIGGGLGVGGSASTDAGAGGGGGYYGGGASEGSGGGGGSSYIISTGSGTMISGGSTGEGLITISW